HDPDVGEIHYPYLFDLFDEDRLSGLDRLRVPAKGRDARGPRLGQDIRHRLDARESAPHPARPAGSPPSPRKRGEGFLGRRRRTMISLSPLAGRGAGLGGRSTRTKRTFKPL